MWKQRRVEGNKKGMTGYEWILCLAANIASAVGAYTDIREHKIYNKMTIPVIGLGILLNLFFFGFDGLINSFSGLFVGLLFSLFWIIGMLKAGDIKLYMAVGALCGWRFCSQTMISSVLVGGAAAAVLMLFRKSGSAAIQRLKNYFLNLLYTKEFKAYQPEGEDMYFSFGCCILAGTLISTWYSCFR